MHVQSIARTVRLAAAVAISVSGSFLVSAQEPSRGQGGFAFKTSVDLVSLNATVTDASGHAVAGLRAQDFVVYEDGERQEVSQFEAERVPVSLGLVVDTSGSMAGEKMSAAQAAVSRFVVDLLGPRDQVFLYRFDSRPRLVQGWTDDRRAIVRSLDSVTPAGGTALYEAVAEAVPLAATGTRRKRAVVVISDGNDTDSAVTVGELRQLIRESEVMVYAIGIDGSGAASSSGASQLPLPWPGGGTIQLPWPRRQPAPPTRRAPARTGSERVNVEALRMITDDSGGRTEIIYSARDLEPATAGIASELSQQYFLGYVSTRPKDGRWHDIEVRVRNGSYVVRARRGYVAS
jgi:Ca-activated chloride channel family protein